MKEKAYIDHLFADYENTPEIQDFKEEVTANFKDRIKELLLHGHTAEEAFQMAAAELGDITLIADLAAKKKRTQTIGEIYMNAKVPLSKKNAIGFTFATAMMLIGSALAISSFISTSNIYTCILSVFSIALSIGLYTHFGLSRETNTHYAMSSKRAAAYGASCASLCLGIGFILVSLLLSMQATLGSALLFNATLIILGICGFVFLGATQQQRCKPWFVAMMDSEIQNHSYSYSGAYTSDIVDPVRAARFGVASGGLWTLALVLFITLGIFIGWEYAWLCLLFALPIQVFMIIPIFKHKK